MATQVSSKPTESGRASQGSRARKQAAVNVQALEDGEYWLYYGDDDGNVDETKEPVNVGTCTAQEFDAVLSSWVDLLDTSTMSEQDLAALNKRYTFIFDRASWPLGHRQFALQQCLVQLDYFPLVRSEQDANAASEDAQEAVEV